MSELETLRDAVARVRAIHRPTMPGYGPKACVHDGRAWPCPTIAALEGAPEPDDEPCDAEVHSWDYYRPEQIDSYRIRCTMLGKHDEHEDSHTGLKWRSGLPVEGEKP